MIDYAGRWGFSLGMIHPAMGWPAGKGSSVMYVTVKMLWLGLAVALVNVAAAVELVRDGQPMAQIVVAQEALPQVRTAAGELQYYLEKMSGALLPIVHQPGSEFAYHVYVG
ncbi:MAG: hypothetical protein LC725_03780, partial [Lentisphaerae bacterium]|nr:hypothetical protein [Lentisphaerota bacterium]